MKTSQTFVLGAGTLTMPNGDVYPCTELIITSERDEMVNELGQVVHVGPPRTNIKLRGRNDCRYASCRANFPDRVGGCAAISCGVD